MQLGNQLSSWLHPTKKIYTGTVFCLKAYSARKRISHNTEHNTSTCIMHAIIVCQLQDSWSHGQLQLIYITGEKSESETNWYFPESYSYYVSIIHVKFVREKVQNTKWSPVTGCIHIKRNIFRWNMHVYFWEIFVPTYPQTWIIFWVHIYFEFVSKQGNPLQPV